MTQDVIQHITAHIDYLELGDRLVIAAKKQALSFVIYRLPNSDRYNFIACQKSKTGTPSFESENSGFLISPFDNPQLSKTELLADDIRIQFGPNQHTQVSHLGKLPNQLLEAFFDSLKHPIEHNGKKGNTNQKLATDSSQEDFESLVQLAINDTLKNNHLKKVVLSRKKEIALSSPTSMSGLLKAIEGKHTNSMFSFVCTPKHGTWVGLTPETLVHIDEHNIFKTVALAGTQANLVDDPKEASWKQKEIEEQALVSRYIINCFKVIRLREFEEDGPKTAIAGNLLHLKSDFIVDINEVNFHELGTVMLELLHPTSAVCGMPKEPATAFIKAHEKHERSLYSGFLGPINIDNDSHIFVNLRCAQLHESSATLYAGAGITSDSNPQKEWIETEMKCETIRQILQD